MPGGRPRKYSREDTAKMADTIMEHMSRGASCIEVAAELNMCMDTFYKYSDPEEGYLEFADAVKKGRALCEAWWMKKGRENIDSKVFRDALWYMNMKNRFGWVDKQEVTGKNGGPLQAVINFGSPQQSEKRKKK